MMRMRSIRAFLLAMFLLMLFGGCGKEDSSKKRDEAEFQKKLTEAKAVAEKIRSGDIFDEEAIIREKLLSPANVCLFSADFSALDFGPEPEFRGDGDSVVYSDKSGTIHYYFFRDRRRYRVGKEGRNPSFGMYQQDENAVKYIFEHYKLKPNSWEGENVGIVMNTEGKWLDMPIEVTQIPGLHPYLVNQDQTIIFQLENKYYQLDEKLQQSEITEKEYTTLRDSRFPMENQWKIMTSYGDIEGVWITDLEEKNWVQLRDLKDISVMKIIPKKYYIYVWSKDNVGICMIKFDELQQYTIELPQGTSGTIGELFEIYENDISPISKEVIGYKKDKLKGVLRVTSVVGNKAVCEYQTRLFGEGVFKGYAAVNKSNNSIIGKVL